MREQVEDVLSSHFKPEFLNRIDDVVIFQRLPQGPDQADRRHPGRAAGRARAASAASRSC